MRITNYKPVGTGPVVASFDISYPESNEIPAHVWRDYRVMKTAEKYWISGPSRQYESDGKKKFYNFQKFDEMEGKDKFDAIVLRLLKPHMNPEVPF